MTEQSKGNNMLKIKEIENFIHDPKTPTKVSHDLPSSLKFLSIRIYKFGITEA